MTITTIENYHVHVYYIENSKPTAERVVALAASEFGLTPGKFHDGPVGPHPIGSCQLTVEMDQFGNVLDWFARNRDGLTLFIHANTGDVMKDHTDHTIWMGEMMALDLVLLQRLVDRR